MDMNIFLVLSLKLLQHIAVGRVVMLPEDKIEKCADSATFNGTCDFTNLKIVFESDTDIFLNGSIVLAWKGLKSPMKARVFAEKFIREKWVSALVDKKISDWCKVMHNPMEVYYNLFKDQPGCDIPEGVRAKLL